MRRLVVASAALALGVLGAVPATAADQSRASGGCYAAADFGGTQVLLSAAVALHSTARSDLPVSADVHCLLYDGGWNLTGQATFSGTTWVAGAQLVPGYIGPGATTCMVVDFTSDATPDYGTCERFEDQLLCSLVLRNLVPGVGPVAIVGEGDVYVAGTLVWDCPPYA